MLYLTNLPILRLRGILSKISRYNDRVAGSKKIIRIWFCWSPLLLCERGGAKRRRVSYVTDQTAISALGNCKKYFSAPMCQPTKSPEIINTLFSQV